MCCLLNSNSEVVAMIFGVGLLWVSLQQIKPCICTKTVTFQLIVHVLGTLLILKDTLQRSKHFNSHFTWTWSPSHLVFLVNFLKSIDLAYLSFFSLLLCSGLMRTQVESCSLISILYYVRMCERVWVWIYV